VVLVGFTVLVMSNWAPPVDLDRTVGSALVIRDADRWQSLALDVLTAPGLTVVRYLVLLPAAIVLAVRRQTWAAVVVAGTATIVAVLTTLLKAFVGRGRPMYAGASGAADGFSFPSGHSSGIVVLAGVDLLVLWPALSPRWRRIAVAVAVALVLVVGWTRLALGVHYLSDVMAGWALGALVVLAGLAVYVRMRDVWSRAP